jgi:exosortase
MNKTGSGWTVWLRRPATYSLAMLTVCMVYLYGFNGNTEYVGTQGRSAIRWMVSRWSGGVAADLSHGWLIPLVSLYALWQRRKALWDAEFMADWRGIFLTVAALFLYWAGVQGQQTRLTLVSLVLLLWSIPFAFWGWGVARQMIFPVGYLIFCIPLSFLDSLTFPLRLFASTVSAEILNGLGIETVRTGTAIHSAAGGGFNFEVADPCSGLRSVLAMTALTAAYAHFVQRGTVRQWLLFLAAFPLAVAGNIVRIVMIGVVALLFGQERATGFYHDYSGYVFFFAATGLMLATASLLNRDWRSAWANALSRLRARSRS